METFLYHEACPKCGSRDNVGVWEDGHKWCFGCGWYQPAHTSLKSVDNYYNNKTKNASDLVLPDDCTNSIPVDALDWLRKFNISNEDRLENHLLWSKSKEMLIFPFYGNGELLLWQGRYFPSRKPKVYTSGNPERHLIIKGDYRNSVVIVEDPVSLIRVGKVQSCSCLFGSFLSKHKAIQLSRYFDDLILWLDNDKIKEMWRYKNSYAHLFKNVKIIITDKDPKCYSTEEISNFLKE